MIQGQDPRLMHPGHIDLHNAAQAVAQGKGLPFLSGVEALSKLRAGYSQGPAPPQQDFRARLIELLSGRRN